MSPLSGIETIASLIPIYLHLQKLSRKIQLWTHSLLPNYIINSMLKVRHSSNKEHHLLSMENLTTKQKLKIKRPIVDINNRLNGIFKLFDLFNLEFSLGNRLVDLFSSHISFSHSDRRSVNSKKSHQKTQWSHVQCFNRFQFCHHCIRHKYQKQYSDFNSTHSYS